MDLLMEKFQQLSLEDKNEAAKIITTTQELLGNGTLLVLGLKCYPHQLTSIGS